MGIKRIRFHKDILVISLLNLIKIKKCYSDILGLNYIDHLSINIVNPANEIVFLSSTPLTGINVCSTDLWKHDASIHPQTFTTKNFYWWDECYDGEYYHILKSVKERANGLSVGFILVKKIESFLVQIGADQIARPLSLVSL